MARRGEKTRFLHTVCHCVKSVQIQSCFWSVFSCLQTEHRKIRTRNNSVFGHFSRSVLCWPMIVDQYQSQIGKSISIKWRLVYSLHLQQWWNCVSLMDLRYLPRDLLKLMHVVHLMSQKLSVFCWSTVLNGNVRIYPIFNNLLCKKKKKMIASAGVILVTCSARFRKFVLKKPRLILIYIYRLKTKMEK